MRGNFSLSVVFSCLGLVALLLLAGCVELDEPVEDSELLTVEQEIDLYGMSLRVGYDRADDEIVAVVNLYEPTAGSAVILIGRKVAFGEGECFSSGRCTSLAAVRDQRVRVSFAEGRTRAVARFSIEDQRRRGGFICFQAFTRQGQSRAECTEVPRSPVAEPRDDTDYKAEGASDAQCATNSGVPETCALTSGCAVGVGDVCHDEDAACEVRANEATCYQAPECRWTYSGCVPRGVGAACDTNSTRTDCFYDPGCMWFLGHCVATPPDELPCEFLDAWSCQADDTCLSSWDSCETLGCDANTDRLSCVDSGCYWYPSDGRCSDLNYTNCNDAYTEALCNAAPGTSNPGYAGCLWIAPLEFCVPRPNCDSYFGDQAACLNAGCQWLDPFYCY